MFGRGRHDRQNLAQVHKFSLISHFFQEFYGFNHLPYFSMKYSFTRSFGLLLLAFCLTPLLLFSQEHPHPIYVAPDAPDWMQLMQADPPNVFEVERAYSDYYSKHPFEKNSYTKYFKRWMHWARPLVQPDGSIRQLTPAEMAEQEARLRTQRAGDPQRGGGNFGWTFAGPNQTFDTDGTTEVTWQTNIYCVDIAPSDNNVIYAGGETGGLWRSSDKGLHWILLTQSVFHGSFGAVKVHPADAAILYAATKGKIIKSVDAGASWTTVYTEVGLWVNELAISPTNPAIILAASDQGLLRTETNGMTWTKIHTQQTWTVKFKVGSPNTVFTARKSGNSSDFRISTDAGASFSNSNTGWWSPAPSESCTGVIIAVCPSNASKLYAYIIGSGSNLKGYVGVFVSTNSGTSWVNTHPTSAIGNNPIPYSIPNHTNLMTNNGEFSGFEQGFYDMAIIVNPSNENEIIAGGTSWFKSSDGGESWDPLGGYVGGLPWSHPDLQALAVHGNDLWIASDGGLNYSPNFAETMEARMNGISGADLWGFDSGWNEDVLVGGRYHNGNMAWHQSFPAGKFYRMGGAESATGYVNPGDNRKTYFSDIGGYRLLGGFGDGVGAFSVGLFPNESYAHYANSEMAWDPRCWNIVYIGFENKIWKSTDGGTSYSVLHTFPGTSTNNVYEIEVSRSNPEVIYCSQWDGTDDAMWRSDDGGQTWDDLAPLPLPNNNDRVKMAVSAENEDILWVALTYGSNGKKIYKTLDGGGSWINLTTSALDGYTISNIMAQYGTNGGIYLGTSGGVFYRNNLFPSWIPFSFGLPVSAETNRLKPFYRDGKIRNGTWGFGVWESNLFEPSSTIAQPIASALKTNCSRDTIFFDDYSVVKQNASTTWSWAFSPQPQYVSATNVRTPKVVFGNSGTYTATMTLNGTFTKSLNIVVTNGCEADTIPDRSVKMGGNTSEGYVAVPPLAINTNAMTITAWIKPNGIQPDYSAIFMHDGETAGFNFREGNNTIGYHWSDGSWWWDSGLIAPADQWSYVAMVVEPTGISLYVNGKKATHNFTVPAVNFNQTSRLGNYKGWDGRYMNGAIEEVCVFDKSLTQNEVRELMHLTKKPVDFPNLISYYQFNEPSGIVLDRVATRHASLVGSAVRNTSTAPVGIGNSFRRTVTAGGAYDFGSTGLTLGFPATGTYPNGELCVSRIRLVPDQLPNANPHSIAYWVVNNYGTNGIFSPLDSLRFENVGNIATGANPAAFQLFKRGSTADGNSWGTSIDNGDAVTPGINGSVLFSTTNGVQSFSQFVITTTAGPLPVEWLDFQAGLQPDHRSVRLYWSVNQTPDVSHFIVEKSSDGIAFQSIGQVTARPLGGLQNYETADKQPVAGLNYYRLRQVDVDGKASLSPVRVVALDLQAEVWSLYPNPLGAGQSLTIQTQAKDAYRLRLFDVTGKVVLEKNLTGTAKLDNLNLPAGFYGYEILSDVRRVTGKVVVD